MTATADSADEVRQVRADYRTVEQIVTDRLRKDIVSGRYRPGERLQQDRLCAELGVSRTPIREALRQLVVEGFVLIEPHVGATIAPIDGRDVQETFALRILVETEAARLSVPRLTDEHFGQLAELFAQMETCIDNESADEFLKIDQAFHDTIYGLADNRRLLALIEQLRITSTRYRRTFSENASACSQARGIHQALFTATIARAVDDVVKSITRMLEIGRDEVLMSVAASPDPLADGAAPVQAKRGTHGH